MGKNNLIHEKIIKNIGLKSAAADSLCSLNYKNKILACIFLISPEIYSGVCYIHGNKSN